MDTNLIPPGPYCYSFMDVQSDGLMPPQLRCPYWELREDKPVQMNGYCRYMKRGDWDDQGHGLLWDQCKECNITNDEINDENFYATEQELLKWVTYMLISNMVPYPQIHQVVEWIRNMEIRLSKHDEC